MAAARALGPALMAFVAIVPACASPQPPPARSAELMPHVAATRTEPAKPRAEAATMPSTPPIPPELERLARSVRALEGAAGDPAHHRLTRSLRDAADALAELEPDVAAGSAALRCAAERIEASSVDSLDHADELRAALVAARDRLRAHGSGAERALDAALGELGRAVDDLGARRPLLEQQPAVGAGLRALADALFLAAGHDAPFAGRAPEPRSVADVMAQARGDVLALGRADLSNIRKLTSRAMYSMAELLEAIAGRGQAASAVEEIRADARRLQHDSSGPFARAGWVERGLQRALSALDGLEVCRKSLIEDWTQAARRAAGALPERGALPFQHAAMQDAFRATVDAFGVALLDRDRCPASERRSPRASVDADEPGRAR
jgi:hypothetical protein